jgi:hypothetical protein
MTKKSIEEKLQDFGDLLDTLSSSQDKKKRIKTLLKIDKLLVF